MWRSGKVLGLLYVGWGFEPHVCLLLSKPNGNFHVYRKISFLLTGKHRKTPVWGKDNIGKLRCSQRNTLPLQGHFSQLHLFWVLKWPLEIFKSGVVKNYTRAVEHTHGKPRERNTFTERNNSLSISLPTVYDNRRFLCLCHVCISFKKRIHLRHILAVWSKFLYYLTHSQDVS